MGPKYWAATLLAVGHLAGASLPVRFDKWLKQDVVYIITDEERKAFLKLGTDTERDRFVQEFWDIRNPLRGASKNPYKDEHYARIQYANENFGLQTGTPGWMTDMGRTWILFGKPESRNRFKGYGQLYPIELWFYSNKFGNSWLPPFFYVMFFMPEDIGDYRYYHPLIDGPLKLVHGSQFQSPADVYNFLKPIGGDLARASLSLIPSEPIDTESFRPSMTSEMLVSKLKNYANDPSNVRRLREMRSLREQVKSWVLVQEQKPLDLQWIALSDPLGQYWLDYAVLVDDVKLGHSQGDQFALNIGYRLLTEKGELVLEDSEERTFPAYEENQFHPFLVANRIPLVPSRYKLEVQITNRVAGRSYHGEQAVALDAQAPAAFSGPLMATAERARQSDPLTPFQYFGVQFQPLARHQTVGKRSVEVLLQLQAPSREPGYEVDYVLANLSDRQERQTLRDTVPARELERGRLLRAKTLDLQPFDAGEYRLAVRLRAIGSPQVLASATAPLRIAEDQPQPPLYFLSNLRGLAAPGVTAYLRALEAVALGQDNLARTYLEQSVTQAPDYALAGRLLAQLAFRAGDYGRVASLYEKQGFEDAPEALAMVVVSYRKTGQADKARQTLEAARSRFPHDPVLAGLVR